MKIHRFFLDPAQLAGGALPEKGRVVVADKNLAHQMRHVLRFQVGHQVVLLDNSGNEYAAHIEQLTNTDVVCEIDACVPAKNSPRRALTIYMALSKRDSFEMVLEKGTELGAQAFVPVLSERSEKKSLNMERARRIVQEAAEQSERAILPSVADVHTLAELLASTSRPTGLFVLDPRGEKMPANFLQSSNNQSDLNVCIGPEGGWSEKEIALFREHNIPVYSLGPHILRAETAAIACSAIALLS